jgi:voltage-gated potassium channel
MADRLLDNPITVWRASRAIALVTALVTIAGGLLVRVIDSGEFNDLGESLWWSLQTVTTVGYGDIVPSHASGQIVGALLMVSGVGFLAVVTGSIAAAFTQAAMRRGNAPNPETAADADLLTSRIDELISRIERLEQAVRDSDRPVGPGKGA